MLAAGPEPISPARTRSPGRRGPVLVGLLALALAPRSASAQEDESTAVAQLQAMIDAADPYFGQWVVSPIASVLFQDLVFWDDGLSRVNAASFGRGRALHTGGEDGRLLVWDDAQLGRAHDLGAGPIRALAARPEHDQVAVGLGTGEVWLVDAASGRAADEYDGLEGAPSALGFDATGTMLVQGTDAGVVRALALEDGYLEGGSRVLFRDPGASVRDLVVQGSTTSAVVAWTARPREILVGPITGGAPRVLTGHRRGVSALAFGPDGTLAAGGDDGRVLLYPPGATEPAKILAFSEDAVVDLAHPRSDRLVVGRPGGVEVVELGPDGWRVARTIKTPVIALDVEGTRLAVTRDQGQVRRFDLATGEPVALLAGHDTEIVLPIIVVWLVAGAVFFTFRFGFVNIRAFRHAIDVTRGKFDGHAESGDVSHFQALAMALSATVGLGNIAGVAIAVGAGGPGAVFWMIVAGFLGMSSKFAECTLGQMYRTRDHEGKVTGGPMHYLSRGLAELSLPRFGKLLSVVFAALCILGSLGGGNMFQANQSYAQVATVVTVFQGEIGSLVYGLILSGLVGIVIIGGIHRIGQVASLIVPFMVGIYIVAAIFIVVVHVDRVPAAFAEIVVRAFSPGAAFGGALGVMVTGFRRAAFSNEAGVGSASIAHSAAATDEPVREGIVALLEPFIDTIVVCTTTALVLVITGAYQTEADGVVMTSTAFESVLPWFPKVLTLAVFLFAFSTMISWSYYGERCWGYLFGHGTSLIYKIVFLCAVVLGSVVNLGSVLTFSDLMILAMAFPNILGVVLLSGKVHARLADYLARLRAGEMRPT